ncbi:MAG TPA: glycosyltransferase family 4 protein [Caldilineaceae bacterium]|nr:glycosyltransferase family 4 protein [Caldilineaceae bacterium]
MTNFTSDMQAGAVAKAGATHPPPYYRVLMIAPTSFFGDYGCHVRILEETTILQKLGHKVTILTYRTGKDVPGIEINRTLPIPWRTNYEVGSSRHKLAYDLLLGIQAVRLLARRRFDIIHAHLHEGALIGSLLGRLFRTPLVFDFQGSLTEEMIDHHFLRRGSLVFGPLRRLEEWINHSAPVILTSTAHAERLLVDQFNCAPEQVVALPDCVDTDTFRPAGEFAPEALAELRQRLGIPADAKVIVYLGLLAEYQGTGLLLAAMTRILQQDPNVYLLLMGFPGVDQYRQQAQELGLANNVILTGRIPYREAPLYLALGNVAVGPKLSLTEGSGKLLDYMAMALPTVAFDTPVAREYLGNHGFYAVRGDTASLAATLLAALQAAERGLLLRQRATQQFEWLRAGQQISSVYRRLIEKQGTGKVERAWVTTQK